MLPDYLLMTYLKFRDFGVEAPVFLVILDHFCAHLVHFLRGKNYDGSFSRLAYIETILF